MPKTEGCTDRQSALNRQQSNHIRLIVRELGPRENLSSLTAFVLCLLRSRAEKLRLSWIEPEECQSCLRKCVTATISSCLPSDVFAIIFFAMSIIGKYIEIE